MLKLSCVVWVCWMVKGWQHCCRGQPSVGPCSRPLQPFIPKASPCEPTPACRQCWVPGEPLLAPCLLQGALRGRCATFRGQMCLGLPQKEKALPHPLVPGVWLPDPTSCM